MTLLEPYYVYERDSWSNDNYPITIGPFKTEKESTQRLDIILERLSVWFDVYKEVAGHFVVNTGLHEKEGCRIDRILMPTANLVSEGWHFGAIGIEAKKSRIYVGRPISQCLDYRQAAFRVGADGLLVMLDQVFLWPFPGCGGALQSVMSQRRVGGLYEIKDTKTGINNLCFSLFQQLVLSFSSDGEIKEFKAAMFDSHGRRRGSR